MTKRSDRRAIEADWHAPISGEDVAKRHGVDPSYVDRVWAAARRAGRLPNGRRPRRATRVTLPPAAAPASIAQVPEFIGTRISEGDRPPAAGDLIGAQIASPPAFDEADALDDEIDVAVGMSRDAFDRLLADRYSGLHVPGFVLGSASEARRIPKRDPLLAALKREHGADPHRRTDDSLVTDRRAATPRELVVRLMRVRDLETQSVSMGQV